MQSIIKVTSILVLLFSFTSCEKIIEIDLEDAEPRIVIEANLDAETAQLVVIVSRTADYFNSAETEFLSSAEVTLKDGFGNTWDIPFMSNGRYEALIDGLETNALYSMQVVVEGNTFNATSFLPETVELLNLTSTFQEANAFFEEGYQVRFQFLDPANEENYYRIIYSINGEEQRAGDNLQVLDDALFNGGGVDLPLFQEIFVGGETIGLKLLHIDEASFDYFDSLSDIISAGGGPGGASAAPGNPNSNWSGNALGYFSSFSHSELEIILP